MSNVKRKPKKYSAKIQSDFPDQKGPGEVQLHFSGHRSLGSQLHGMGILESPSCKLCSGDIQDYSHFFTEAALSSDTLVDVLGDQGKVMKVSSYYILYTHN